MVTKSKSKSKAQKEKWFNPRTHSGWSKDMPEGKRRRLVLEAHKGNYLSAARSKMALANVTRDRATKLAARADAKYFFDLYKKQKEKEKGGK